MWGGKPPPADRSSDLETESRPKKSKRGSKLPDNFEPKEQHKALAEQLGVNLAFEFPKFQDHHIAKGSVMKDWNAALRTWIRKAAEFSGGRRTGPPAGRAGYLRDRDRHRDYYEGVNPDGTF